MELKVVGGWEFAWRKSFVKRAVIAETGSDLPPFREERLVGSAARDVPADRHRAESAAVIALAARENAITILLAAFEVKLSCKLNRGFGRFRAARSKIDTAAVTKIRRSHRKQS